MHVRDGFASPVINDLLNGKSHRVAEPLYKIVKIIRGILIAPKEYVGIRFLNHMEKLMSACIRYNKVCLLWTETIYTMQRLFEISEESHITQSFG